MLTCKQLAEDVASEACQRRGWLYRLKMRWHKFMCPACQTYAEQMESISAAAKHTPMAQEPSPEKLEEMQQRCLFKLAAEKISQRGESS